MNKDIVAALMIAGAAIYAINVWSTTKKETAPDKKTGAGNRAAEVCRRKSMESRQ
jgi:hypothetical protein